MTTTVENMRTSSGNVAPNQFHLITVEDDGSTVSTFQSYSTVIVEIRKGKVTLDPAWKCSVTTSRYRSAFLNESTKDTQRKVDSGEYTVKGLN